MFEAFIYLVALILVIAPFFDWSATYILRRAAKEAGPNASIALKERARIAGILATATSLNALLAVNRLFDLHFKEPFALIILSASLILVSLPNMYWLYLYVRNRFQ